jgi:TRAP-type C4-dicarboxylate transport system substrate-binding protein
MRHSILQFTVAAALLVPNAASAEPIKLKLSFFTSDRSVAYQTAVKPFVDAINSDPRGLVEIKVYFSGALGKVQRELPQQVLDGTSDIAFIVPGQNPELFSDTTAIELPGLFRDVREATLTYTRLVASGALVGYKDFFVIGAYGTQPEIINSRKPINSLADLKGQRIRANNTAEATALAQFGALPVVLAFNETSPALAGGALDGATVPPAQLFDVGIGRLTNNHYFLGTSVAPLALMMNKKVFDALPEDAKAVILKYSGEWTAKTFIEAYEAIDKMVYAEIKADHRRNVIMPSPSDAQMAQRAFKSIIDSWAATNARNGELFKLTEAELTRVRADEATRARAAVPKDE